MPKLPAITFQGVRDDAAAATGQLAQATRGLAGTLSEGLTAYGQELLKTQHQEAATQLQAGLNDLEAGIHSKPQVSVDELKSSLGDDFDKLPQEIRERPLVAQRDPATGEVRQAPALVPMWQVAGALYQKGAKELLDRSSQGITDTWRGAFQRAAAPDIVSRFGRLNEQMLQAMHADIQGRQDDQNGRALNTARTTSEFDSVRSSIEGSNAFSPAEKLQRLRMVDVREQTLPIIDALSAPHTPENAERMKALIGRLEEPTAFPALKPEERLQHIEQLRAQVKQTEVEDAGKQGEVEAMTAYRTAIPPGTTITPAAEQRARDIVDGLPPGRVKDEAMRRLDKRLADAREVRAQRVTQLVNTGISQFEQGGHSIAAISPAVKAAILNPVTGKPEEWWRLEQMEKNWEAAKKGEPPTAAQQDAYGQMLWDLANNPKKFDGWDMARFRAEYGPVLSPHDYEPAFRSVATALARPDRAVKGKAAFDYMRQVGEASGAFPKADHGSVKRSDPGTWQEQWQRDVLNEASRRLQGWMDTLTEDPTPAEYQQKVDEIFREGTVPGKIYGRNKTTAIVSEARGEKGFTADDEAGVRAAFKRRGILAPAPEQVKAAMDALQRARPAPPPTPAPAPRQPSQAELDAAAEAQRRAEDEAARAAAMRAEHERYQALPYWEQRAEAYMRARDQAQEEALYKQTRARVYGEDAAARRAAAKAAHQPSPGDRYADDPVRQEMDRRISAEVAAGRAERRAALEAELRPSIEEYRAYYDSAMRREDGSERLFAPPGFEASFQKWHEARRAARR